MQKLIHPPAIVTLWLDEQYYSLMNNFHANHSSHVARNGWKLCSWIDFSPTQFCPQIQHNFFCNLSEVLQKSYGR